jgi:GNAT superfamily N-acetyltransferase
MGQSGELQFRQAEPEDDEAVLEIKQAAIEAAGAPYSDEQIEAWRPTTEALPAFTQAMESEQFVVLLVETDDGPAGYGVLNIDEARIDAVFVAPEHAGEGLGSSLVRQLETRARMLGLEELTVVSSLNAQKFYESLGYEPAEDRTRTIDGTDLEFVAVRKQLE